MQNEWRDDCTLKVAMIDEASRQLSKDKCQREGYPPGKVMDPHANQKIPDRGFRNRHHNMSLIEGDSAIHFVTNKALQSVKCLLNAFIRNFANTTKEEVINPNCGPCYTARLP